MFRFACARVYTIRITVQIHVNVTALLDEAQKGTTRPISARIVYGYFSRGRRSKLERVSALHVVEANIDQKPALVAGGEDEEQQFHAGPRVLDMKRRLASPPSLTASIEVAITELHPFRDTVGL